MPKIDSQWQAVAVVASLSAAAPQALHAETVTLTVQSAAEADALADTPGREGDTRPVRIFVGPQYVSGSAISQPARTEVAGNALVASFSSQPFPFGRATTGIGQMPLGTPVSGRLTSSFGLRYHPIHGGERYHAGIDVAAPSGSPIKATSDGVVSGAGWSGGYGILVQVNHGAGIETRYAHMSAVNVAVGQHVRRGDVIGFVGSTGNSTGPHVHYEVRRNGQAVDPLSH